MSEPYVGQIQIFGFNFAPRGWALCDGQVMAITTNTALFSLLGTTYGGNGTSNFALPDMRGRVSMHRGNTYLGNYVQGEQAGVESVQLIINEMPSHNHTFSGATASANDKRPLTGAAFAQTTKAGPISPGDAFYAADTSGVTAINPNTVQPYGAGLAHTNLQPFLVVNFCIALQGIFPAHN